MSLIETIKQRVLHSKRGQPFTAKELSELGSRNAIDQALSRLASERTIERVKRGVYVRPKQSPVIGPLPVSAEKVTKKVVKARGEKLQVSGAEAANRLGLTTQVPTKLVYWTNGPTRTVKVEKQEVQLKHVSPSKLLGAGTEAGLAIAALHHLSREDVTPEVIEHLRTILTIETKTRLRRMVTRVPAWMSQALLQISA